MNKKALSLFSGGLDSTLATKLILDQGVDVVGFHFTSHFASKRDKERGLQAIRTAKELGIRLIVKNKGDEYIEIIKKPRYGYGKNMNPCIDCRIFMLEKAALVMAEEEAGFLITGEVVGQRPMSQKRHTIELIEKRSNLAGLIVRPLSAKLFPPTKAELEGVIDREKLLGISGRSRETQNNLVRLYNLKEFARPGGGCLLTDPIFARKLKNLMESDKAFTPKDIELLTIGRYFRLNNDTMLILGRNQEENKRLESFWEFPYILFSPMSFNGPKGILKGPLTEETIRMTANIMAFYSKDVALTITIELNNGSLEIYEVERKTVDIEKIAM
ncbi:MAG: tRNA 4-thiouridine(8) synthase ThiI [Syntrophus sp. (in: bacteria)]|nr:tRNA 4-thiouridine(8) synthase ThiI [Syntrophus sp. (in: bacteria)]